MNPLLSALIRLVLTAAGAAAASLPRSWELTMGPALGRLALRLDGKRRRIAADNIRRCLPALTAAGREKLLRENYEHYGVLFFELLHMFSPWPGHYRRYVRSVAALEGLENWKRAHDRGRGVLLVSAHLANWEFMAAMGGLSGVPLTIVTRHLKPEWLRRKMLAQRRSAGFGCFDAEHPAPQVLRALRRGEAVGFVLDQYAPPPAGVAVPFFGVRVNTLAAVGVLAQRTGAAVVPVSQRRGADGVVRVTVEPEIGRERLGADPVETTELLAAHIERWIRREPGQWLWAHRRFKNVAWPDEVRPERAPAAPGRRLARAG